MSVATELTRILAAKAAIRAAIEAKGVTVPLIDTLDDYAAHIAAISTGSPTAPAAFTAGQWTAAATAVPGEISFNLDPLPSNGGSAYTALEYRVGTGSAIAFTGTGPGVRVVTAGLTAGAASDLQVRGVNAVGAGAWSDTKNRTPLAAGGAAPVISDSSRAGPSAYVPTLAITPPPAMANGDQLVVLTFGAAALSSTDSGGTFTDRTPPSWVAAGVGLYVSNAFATPPGAFTMTFGGSGINEAAVIAVSDVLTSAVIGHANDVTGTSTGARDHAYTSTLINSLLVGYISFTGGSVTAPAGADAFHEWVLGSGGYNHAFAKVRPAAGAYVASLGADASSPSEYGWAEIGAA